MIHILHDFVIAKHRETIQITVKKCKFRINRWLNSIFRHVPQILTHKQKYFPAHFASIYPHIKRHNQKQKKKPVKLTAFRWWCLSRMLSFRVRSIDVIGFRLTAPLILQFVRCISSSSFVIVESAVKCDLIWHHNAWHACTDSPVHMNFREKKKNCVYLFFFLRHF